MSLRRVFCLSTVLALGSLVLLVPGTSVATEWSATPSVTLDMEQNDNPLLTATSHKSVTGFTLIPHIDLSAAQDAWAVTGGAELRDRRYWGQKGLDANDQIYTLSSLYRTERSTWQFNGGDAKESVISGQTFSPDVGVVQTQTQRNTRAINPSWTWSMTERTQLQLSYQSNDVSYQNAINVGLFNYTSRDSSANLLYQWSPRDQLTLQIDSAYYKVPKLAVSQLGQPSLSLTGGGLLNLQPNPRQLSSTSTTNSVSFGITHAFSETLSGNIGLGTRKTVSDAIVESCTSSTPPTVYVVNGQQFGIGTCTKTADATQSSSGTGSIFSAGLDEQLELTHVALSLSRQINPSGSGTQVQVDSATLGIDRKISARLSAGLSMADYRIRALSNDNAQITNRDYFQIGPSLSWNWTEKLTVQGGYRYIHQKYLDINNTAASNSVYLIFAYAWSKFSVSR